MGIDQEKIIRTLRLSLTYFFLFIITWYFEVPEGIWALVTISFVMYEYTTVGGVYTKSVLRFTGTALSGAYGLFIIYFCANDPMINTLALLPALLLFAYYFQGGDKTYIGTIGSMTLCIVLLNYNDVSSAVIRVFNVMLGITLAMIMMRFFYPQYARDKLLDIQYSLISECILLTDMYLNLTYDLPTVHRYTLEQEQQLKIKTTDYKRYLSEAKIETKKAPFYVKNATTALDYYLSLFQLMKGFIIYASTEDNRRTPRVRAQLNHLLFELRKIQHLLLRTPHQTEQKHVQKSHVQKSNNKSVTDRMLNGILEQAKLFGEEIKEMVLIYDIYNVTLDNYLLSETK